MDLIKLERINDCDVVDSRLIAMELGIQHKNLLETIRKYQDRIEKKGVLSFKQANLPNRGRPETFCYLNKEQVIYLINTSRCGVSPDFVYKCKINGFDLTGVKIFEPKQIRRKKRKEVDYAKALAKTLNGKREVATLAGNIDILTTSEIIEVKQIRMWKHALGQVLVYGSYYPSHKKRIHLYGETQTSFLNMIKRHCKAFNVKVTWES